MVWFPVEYFDKDENNTGALTAKLSDNPQKVNGLAGITLGAIVQSISTIILGSVLGLAFIWKLALVGIACTPLLISAGYIRLVCLFCCRPSTLRLILIPPLPACRCPQGPGQQEGSRRICSSRLRGRWIHSHCRLSYP